MDLGARIARHNRRQLEAMATREALAATLLAHFHAIGRKKPSRRFRVELHVAGVQMNSRLLGKKAAESTKAARGGVIVDIWEDCVVRDADDGTYRVRPSPR